MVSSLPFRSIARLFALTHVARLVSSSNALYNETKVYDYIVVGGGLSGLVVANRLTEDSHISVLVIENGYIDDSPITRIPAYSSLLNTGDMWEIKSAPEPQLNNTIWSPRVGNVVGGGSVVNGMMWDRGSDADYDAWELLGNKGWGFAGLQRYFKKSTHFTPPSKSTVDRFGITYDESAYGHGPVQVAIASFQYPDMKPIWDSWKVEDVPLPEEGFAQAVGVYWTPNSMDNKTATRSHSRKVYYDPVSSRSNLALAFGTRVTKIIIDRKAGKLKATGVEIASRDGASSSTIRASKEVILAAGAVFSPHLLMLSGIGPKDVLSAAKIPVKRDMPGVGANLQDHVPLYMSFNLSNTAFPNPDSLTNNATFNASAAAQYEAERQGPYASGRGVMLAMLSFQQISSKWNSITAKISQQNASQFLPPRYANSPSLLAGYKKQRDVLTKLYSGNDSAVSEFPVQPSGRAAVVHMKPLSRGTITLNNTHPLEVPVLQWNTLQNPIDGEVLAESVRFNRRHWARPELARFEPQEAAPGTQYQSDDELIAGSIASRILQPSFAHMSGTCALMPEHLGGVVDSNLRVYGVESLRVIDASILPLIPSAHLQATMYAVAEKAADIIKGH